MSKRRLLASAAFAAVLAGCATMETPEGPIPSCDTVHVTVTHAPGYLALYPEHVYICKQETLVIETAPPVDEGDAQVVAAGKMRAEWLGGTSDARGIIEIKIPDLPESEYGEYKYSLTIEGIGTLDPRFTVTRR